MERKTLNVELFQILTLPFEHRTFLFGSRTLSISRLSRLFRIVLDEIDKPNISGLAAQPTVKPGMDGWG